MRRSRARVRFEVIPAAFTLYGRVVGIRELPQKKAD
jgi:hypothetical protein